MRLEAEHAPPTEDPDDAAVEHALARLLCGEVNWVALSTDERRTALVSAARGRDGLILEWVHHRVWRCRTELPLDRVAAVFRDFRRGDQAWIDSLAWRDVTNENWWVYLLLAGAAVVILLLLAPPLASFLRRMSAQ